MKMTPLQPHAFWYRRFRYKERPPVDTIPNHMPIFAVVALVLPTGATMPGHHDAARHSIITTTDRSAAR